MKDKKSLKQEYKDTARPLGVFLIRNTTNDKVFLVSSLDLPGGINRHKFQLNAGGHPNRDLQSDWKQIGSDKFEFEILEQLEPPNDPAFDARRELEFLETMWLEKLMPYAERGYNEKKISREERLRRMATNRKAE